MDKLSELMNKPVISLFEGENVGFVESALLDKKLKKIKCLIVNNSPDPATRKCLPANSKLKTGSHAVVIKNRGSLGEYVPEQHLPNCPLNAEVFDSDGNYLGLVKDCALGPDYTLAEIVLDDAQYPADRVLSASPGTVVLWLGSPAARPKSAAPAKKTSAAAEEKTPGAGSKEQKPEQENGQEPAERHEEALLPGTIYADFSYLLGRKATEDIYNRRRERIVRRNSIVTLGTLAACKRFGKLVALARCAVKIY